MVNLPNAVVGTSHARKCSDGPSSNKGAQSPSPEEDPTMLDSEQRILAYPPYCGDLSMYLDDESAISLPEAVINRLEWKLLNDTPPMSPPTANGGLSAQDRPPSVDIQPLSPATREYTPLVDRMSRMIDSKDPFFSLEFFPPRTIGGVTNLLPRLERMSEGAPLFVDITWHPAGDPGSSKETSSSSIAGACLNYCLLETMQHMTCAQYTKEEALVFLERAKCLGIRNILALRGDLPEDDNGKPIYKSEEMKYARDLVKLIRERFGDYFVIGVAGYPTGHPDAVSYQDDLLRLKEKVDEGADFVVTQLFFRVETFVKFERDCREIGITVPIIPGLMPIQSYESLRHICKLSKLDVPQFIVDAIEPIKMNDVAIRNYGVHLAVEVVRGLLEREVAPGVHFYTLNREVATVEILKATGLWREQSIGRILPWKSSIAHHKRCREEVRPIFWASRPRSYLYRTQDWDDFPNGRWGDYNSPAFGELKDYYLFHLSRKQGKEQLLNMWGRELTSEQDVWKLFVNFVTDAVNENGVKVTRLPWGEEDSLSSESLLLVEMLQWCNEHGILTINSQPAVNGAPSTDPVVGWGNPGGYVYQKAYLEFFMNQTFLDAFLAVVIKYPQINYHILNHNESINLCNSVNKCPVAVTWGVFREMEVIQPTVVDPNSFHVWKNEAFDTWNTSWAKIYPEGSKSREILQTVHDTYVLVNLVDNEYPRHSCLFDLLADMVKVKQSDLQRQPQQLAQHENSMDSTGFSRADSVSHSDQPSIQLEESDSYGNSSTSPALNGGNHNKTALGVWANRIVAEPLEQQLVLQNNVQQQQQQPHQQVSTGRLSAGVDNNSSSSVGVCQCRAISQTLSATCHITPGSFSPDHERSSSALELNGLESAAVGDYSSDTTNHQMEYSNGNFSYGQAVTIGETAANFSRPIGRGGHLSPGSALTGSLDRRRVRARRSHHSESEGTTAAATTGGSGYDRESLSPSPLLARGNWTVGLSKEDINEAGSVSSLGSISNRRHRSKIDEKDDEDSELTKARKLDVARSGQE